MTRLSKPIGSIKSHYEIVVIGSGYGGGIAASRLARAGRDVCVLERGRELQPGEYPNTQLSLLKETQTDLPHAHLGSPSALFDLRYNHDINVVVGCGLGGTSLINSGASLRADPRVFEDPVWPSELRDEAELDRYYDYAERMLKPVPYPDRYPRLAKLDALEKSAEFLGEKSFRVPIATNFDVLPDGLNHVGVRQVPCVGCGDCESGCNYSAKTTVLMTYLPDAANHGAAIFTELQVRSISRQDSGKGAGAVWTVHCTRLDGGGDARELAITADIVILGAGTLGSTEILLRSRENGLPTSTALGSRFSGNGDMVGFSYNCDVEINSIGCGDRDVDTEHPPGPCVAGAIDVRQGHPLEKGLVMEGGGVPGAIAGWMPLLLSISARLVGTDTDSGIVDAVQEKYRELKSKLLGANDGAVRNTQTYITVAHDDSGGTMALENDRLRIHWPGVGAQREFSRASEMMLRATEALGGTYVPNPTWNKLTDQQLLTGHPLGGCAMAADAAHGVVNHKGQVYSGETGTGVHPGLFVMDAAVIPRSLGVNPLLAICALAERSCDLLARDRGWTVSYDFPGVARP